MSHRITIRGGDPALAAELRHEAQRTYLPARDVRATLDALLAPSDKTAAAVLPLARRDDPPPRRFPRLWRAAVLLALIAMSGCDPHAFGLRRRGRLGQKSVKLLVLRLSAPGAATAPHPARPAIRRLLARCLADPSASHALDALPCEAAEPWLDHVAAAALCVGETIALFERVRAPITTEALADTLTLPVRHPWRDTRPSAEGLGDLLAALAEVGVVEALGEQWQLVAAFAPLLTGDAAQRSVVASLRDDGFLDPGRLDGRVSVSYDSAS